MKVRRPYAHCCAEGGGDPRYCDCVKPDHGTALFDVQTVLPGDELVDDSLPIPADEWRCHNCKLVTLEIERLHAELDTDQASFRALERELQAERTAKEAAEAARDEAETGRIFQKARAEAAEAEAARLREALAVAVGALGMVNVTCVGGHRKEPGDRARETLLRLNEMLGDEQYDDVAEAAALNPQGPQA